MLLQLYKPVPLFFQASVSQTSPQSASSPRIESATGITTTTSPRTPPPLTVQDPLCPAVCPLEELSPDSIDAHTFDFETIPHPNIEQTIHQASLDLDSLAESPESDFMSAVNEFVIEENLRIFAIVMDMALHFFDIVSLKIKIASYFTRKK